MKNKNYQAFLKMDLSKAQPGQYVVLVDGEFFGRSKDVEKLLKDARKRYPAKTPFVFKMPERGTIVV
ncbi:hypothetical protein HY468_02680 [Candidatus Roizmanbacteria bacterium]|nr:hypothetical protein [Candidatus Roizmanbacteria bacterium]